MPPLENRPGFLLQDRHRSSAANQNWYQNDPVSPHGGPGACVANHINVLHVLTLTPIDGVQQVADANLPGEINGKIFWTSTSSHSFKIAL